MIESNQMRQGFELRRLAYFKKMVDNEFKRGEDENKKITDF